MVSYEGRLCLRPKEMEPRPVKEEDISHQEKSEKGDQNFFSLFPVGWQHRSL